LALIGGGIGIGYLLKKDKPAFTAHVSDSLMKHVSSTSYIVVETNKKIIGKKCSVTINEDVYPSGLVFGDKIEKGSNSSNIIKITGTPGLEGDFHLNIKIDGFKTSVTTLLTVAKPTEATSPIIIGTLYGMLQVGVSAKVGENYIQFTGHNLDVFNKQVSLMTDSNTPQ
jgi:hypothetical protein